MGIHDIHASLSAALLIFLALAAPGYGQTKDKEPERKGSVVGVATAKGGFWIEVKADGEEKARRYFCGSNQEALKAVKSTEVGSRVRLEWRFEEVFRVVRIEVLKKSETKPDSK